MMKDFILNDVKRYLVRIDSGARVCRSEDGGLLIRLSRRMDRVQLGDRIVSWIGLFPFRILMPSKS
jgi:hypothetical protein